MDIGNYALLRDEMRTGDLLQWHSKSLIGKLIRWRTGSKVNHSSLVLRFSEYDSDTPRRFTMEALEHGVVLNLLSRRLEAHDGEVWWYPLKSGISLLNRKIIGERALSMVGIPYDFSSIVKQIIGKVSTDARKLFCSEMCYMAYGYKGTAPNPGEMPSLGIFETPVKL